MLSDIVFAPPPDQVLSRLRVSPDGEDAAAVRDLLARVAPIARPKAIFDVSYVGERGIDTVQIAGVSFISRVLAVNLEKAHRVFPYIATCGVELDRIAAAEHDPLRRYWLEEIKAMALAAALAHLRDHIDSTYRPGRMSAMHPGSLEDWPITQQTELFSLFGDVEARIGVRLTDSFLMVPTKSVSGIFFPTEVSFESCRLCPREGCPGRRAPYEEHLWEERYAVRGEEEET